MNKCKKHPRYKGIRQPQRNCRVCFNIYLQSTGVKDLITTGSCLSNILFNYSFCDVIPENERVRIKDWVKNWDTQNQIVNEKLK